MNFKIFPILLVVILMSCAHSKENTSTLYKGELYIKLITIGDIFSSENEQGRALYERLSTTKDTALLSQVDKDLKRYLNFLESNELLDKSYFHLITQTNDIMTVYVDKEEHKKVNQFKLNNLQENGQTVNIELYGKMIHKTTLVCDEILSVQLTKGQVQWAK